jgi:hypothetical protein
MANQLRMTILSIALRPLSPLKNADAYTFCGYLYFEIASFPSV